MNELFITKYFRTSKFRLLLSNVCCTVLPTVFGQIKRLVVPDRKFGVPSGIKLMPEQGHTSGHQKFID
jgi:hypothetical protein